MLKNARGNGTKERIFMEEKTISAGVSGSADVSGSGAKAPVCVLVILSGADAVCEAEGS